MMNPMLPYVVSFTLSTPRAFEKEKVLLKFDSLMEVRDWAYSKRYVLGNAEIVAPTYAVEHADGSVLSDEELQYLQPENSEALSAEYVGRDAAMLRRAGVPHFQPTIGRKARSSARDKESQETDTMNTVTDLFKLIS